MAGVGLGGFFNGDPNPNPFADIIPASGALIGDNGQAIVDPDYNDLSTFEDQDGYDPPTGNGILNPAATVPERTSRGLISADMTLRYSNGTSKLEQLKIIEESIRDLMLDRKKLLRELKTERDEIDKRLNVSDSVTEMLDEMFPDHLAKEIESGVIDE